MAIVLTIKGKESGLSLLKKKKKMSNVPTGFPASRFTGKIKYAEDALSL